jgi:glutamate synthase domain-containing protein 1/glutamate synthase domain-containing protein 3
MDQAELAEALIASARSLERPAERPVRPVEAEGGCGIIGAASSVPLPGRALLQPLEQMRNRGNGKGGGVAAAVLAPEFFGVRPQTLWEDYLLAIAYLDSSVRPEVEAHFVEPTFEVDHVAELTTRSAGPAGPAASIRPPDVRCYLVRVRPDVLTSFAAEHHIPEAHIKAAADEIVYQHSYRLNHAFYSATGVKRAFVLSHGKNLLVLKAVGYGDDVIRWYGLEDLPAQVWIGHHRYPTKGRVWHPGGAHPFIGLNEALVHNGDFANYASVCSYLRQRNRYPLFLTDTEVAALAFDLLHRVYGYPLEYVIEAMAPTTERDFALLPPEKQRVYRLLQAVHMHGSPDGPWFFLVAQSLPGQRAARLIGVTDTSMLRPQVFALQHGPAAIGVAASEKQAIDALLESASRQDGRFWGRADLYWNARGGSHTDGGAFAFTVTAPGGAPLRCVNKFGRLIQAEAAKRAPGSPATRPLRAADAARLARLDLEPPELFERIRRFLPSWDYGEMRAFFDALALTATGDEGRYRAIALLTPLVDRHYPTGPMKRSAVLSLADACLAAIVDSVRRQPSTGYVWAGGGPLPAVRAPDAVVVLDARGFPSEGQSSLSRAVADLYQRGARRFLVANTRGQRFVGCGLGPASDGVRIDVYGPSGDYLASGIDGAEIVVHGSAQDQVAQIMKDGSLVVHGDIGQTFMYAAKGGEVFVLGNTAGRPLINAAGRPRVVINGTCLDYLAESFMAGDPLNGGGFAVLNGMGFDEDGSPAELDTPYPGGNLFSLALGGAVYIRDPHGRLTEDQLNGGEFADLQPDDWALIRPYLEVNERVFGIPLQELLTVHGRAEQPERVYRKIRPGEHPALSLEEAWVKRETRDEDSGGHT